MSNEVVVYIDESGDHGLRSIDSKYPIFVLNFCIFEVDHFVNEAIPRINRFKFKYFGHNSTILHEHDIRKQIGDFQVLNSEARRESFLNELTQIIDEIDFQIIACVVDKVNFQNSGWHVDDPYRVAFEFVLERLMLELESRGLLHVKTWLIFESRGKSEDSLLQAEFTRLKNLNRFRRIQNSVEMRSVDKKANCEGLQIADLVARPIGMAYLKPQQENRTSEIVRSKYRCSPTGKIEGYGLKIVP